MLEAFKKPLWFGLIAVAALAAGFYVGKDWRHQPPRSGAEEVLRQASFKNLQGQPADLSAWDGKPRILNFWATWCAPCREEIPLLNRVQTEHAAEGLQIIGIAIDEPEKVAKFQQKLSFSFPTLIAGAEAIPLMKTLGNPSGGLPFSVFLAANGRILGTHLGPLDQKALEQALALLKRP